MELTCHVDIPKQVETVTALDRRHEKLLRERRLKELI